MHNNEARAAVASAATSMEKVKGDIVTQTLDKLNGPAKAKKNAMGPSSMSDTYHFSKSILSAVYEGKGTLVDSTR